MAVAERGDRAPAAMGQAVLSLGAITHAYGGIEAVRGVSLEIGRGEVVCLLGPSGCGKTTVLRVAAGLERLQGGRVSIAGRVVADGTVDVPPEDRGVGLVFQDYALFPHLNVRDNVAFGLRGIGAAERRARAREAIAGMGLSAFSEVFPHTLSGGQQQRVALARALAPRPGVMLLDEPFSGLDTRLRDQVRDEALHALKESGAATLLVTHDPEEAMFMADRIAVMRDGLIEQIGTPTELYCTPRSAFVCAFFGEVNRITGIVAGGTVATPFGPLPAPGNADGQPVEVLIRPEAIRLSPAEAGMGAEAQVMAARMLGRSSLIHLSFDDPTGRTLHLHARVPGQFLPAESARLSVALDRAQSFVFARESAV